MSQFGGGGFNIGGGNIGRFQGTGNFGSGGTKKKVRKHVRKGASSARKTARPIKKKDEKRGKKKKK